MRYHLAMDKPAKEDKMNANTTASRPLSLSAALRQAERDYGSVYRNIPGTHGWAYRVFDRERGVWWEPVRMSYTEALASRAMSVAETAVRLMRPGLDAGEPLASTSGSDRGTARQRAQEMLTRVDREIAAGWHPGALKA